MVQSKRLRPFPLFSSASDEQLDNIARLCERRQFDRRHALFLEGQPAQAFYLVEYGKIKVFRTTPEGREQILHVVEPWQSFAEVAVLSMENYPATAEALEECAAIEVPRGPFLELVDSDARLARTMLAGQALWLRRMVDQNTSLLIEDVLTRLARFLWIYAESHGIKVEDGARIDLSIKKTVVASQIGTVPETLARNLKKLCDQGLIEREDKTIIVKDAERLYGAAYPQR